MRLIACFISNTNWLTKPLQYLSHVTSPLEQCGFSVPFLKLHIKKVYLAHVTATASQGLP